MFEELRQLLEAGRQWLNTVALCQGGGVIGVSLGTWLDEQIAVPHAYISYLDLFPD